MGATKEYEEGIEEEDETGRRVRQAHHMNNNEQDNAEEVDARVLERYKDSRLRHTSCVIHVALKQSNRLELLFRVLSQIRLLIVVGKKVRQGRRNERSLL